MAFLSLNGFGLNVQSRTPQRNIDRLGRIDRSARGIANYPLRGDRRVFPMSAVVQSHEAATALERYLLGLGHVHHFSSGLDALTGMQPATGYGGFTFDAASDGAFTGYAGKLVVAGSATLMTIPAQCTGKWSVHWWEDDGGGWDHYMRRDDGAGWANGVRDDTVGTFAGPSTILISESSGSIVVESTGACDLDDLVILKWRATEEMAAAWAAATVPHGPLPIHRVSGDFVVEDEIFCLATNVRVENARVALDANGVEPFAKKVSWVLEEVLDAFWADDFTPDVGNDELNITTISLQTQDELDSFGSVSFGAMVDLEPVVGDASFSATQSFEGDAPPYSMVGPVPDGITIDSATGEITGPLTEQGLLDYPNGSSVQIQDGSGQLSPSFAIRPQGVDTGMPFHSWTFDDADKTGTDPNVNCNDIGQAGGDARAAEWYLPTGGSLVSGLSGIVNECFRHVSGGLTSGRYGTTMPGLDLGAGDSISIMATIKILSDTGADQTFFSRNNVGGTSAYYLQMFDSTENAVFVVVDATGTALVASYNISAFIGDGLFHQYCGVFDRVNNVATLYVDGLAVATSSTSPSSIGALSFSATENPFVFGALQNGKFSATQNVADIEVDESATVDRAWTSEEVATMRWVQLKTTPQTIKDWLDSQGTWTGA